MADYVRHKKSLVSKGKKPKVTTPSASNPVGDTFGVSYC